MKLTDFLLEMESDPEYKKAREKLNLRFELANAILRARLEKGWSQQDLAETIGTKQANISRIEAGLANPTIDFINKLIKQLDLEIKIIPAKTSTFTYEQSTIGLDGVNTAILVLDWPTSNCEYTFDVRSLSSGQKEETIK